MDQLLRQLRGVIYIQCLLPEEGFCLCFWGLIIYQQSLVIVFKIPLEIILAFNLVDITILYFDWLISP